MNRKKEALKRIQQFYAFVVNGMDLRYESVSEFADYFIDVTWAGLFIFDEPVADFWEGTEKPPNNPSDFVEVSSALEAFRAWAEKQNDISGFDHIMLFTGHNLTYGGAVSNAGLAYLGGACKSDYFYSVVEEYFDFRDVAIAAHELGHSLGARHDMDGNTCLSFDRYVMTSRFKFPSRRKAGNPWKFSKCSVEYFTEFIQDLDKNNTNCLVTKDANTKLGDTQTRLTSLPGQLYNGDDFCKLGFGQNSFICRDKHKRGYENICYAGVFCYSPVQMACLKRLPPDGFTCSSGKWCISGNCTSSQDAPQINDNDCPFGDQPILDDQSECSKLMTSSKNQCYDDSFRFKCCASCLKFKSSFKGCEFGNRVRNCEADQCQNNDTNISRYDCCETCSDVLYTNLTPTISFDSGVTNRDVIGGSREEKGSESHRFLDDRTREFWDKQMEISISQRPFVSRLQQIHGMLNEIRNSHREGHVDRRRFLRKNILINKAWDQNSLYTNLLSYILLLPA